MTEHSMAVELQVCLQGRFLRLLASMMQVRAAPIVGVSSVPLVTPQSENCFWWIHSWEMEQLSVMVPQKERPIMLVPTSLESNEFSRQTQKEAQGGQGG